MYFEMKDVVVYYDVIQVLNKISIKVQKGEIVCLIGANGAGKTTILKSISGLIKIASGHIKFNDHEISRYEASDIVKVGIAQVPEERHIFPYMTVRDNLFSGAFVRKNKKEIFHDFNYILDLFPVLKERLMQEAGSMSGGEQQMLAIARSLMSRPELLLLDEPSLGLAPIIIEKIYQAIVEINKRNKVSILLVEQNAKKALEISNRSYVIETGNIALSGESKKIATENRIKDFYFGG